MLLDVNRKLLQRSDRVKGVDFHPIEPWIITGLYNGNVNIYSIDDGSLIKTFEVAEVPVRCVRFIARKQWFVAGSDDFQLRVFNYNTHEKITAFEAHPDYIRCLTVHPTQSIVLTGSDDLTIKAFDWDKQWRCIRVFEGHTHYIMNLAINPKDPNTFASSCLDRTVKVWNLNSSTPNFTMDAHNTGVNYVEYYPGNDKPYLITSADDRTIKVWDYATKSCVQTMEGHTSNVSFAVFHPRLPVIVSGSEDGSVKIWNSGTYRIENTLNYSLERAWCVSIRPNANDVAVGFDEGVVVIKLGRDDPIYSVDYSGKLIFTRNTDILTTTLPQISLPDSYTDGSKIPLPTRDLGTTEIFSNAIIHSPNGRFVTVVGDGEYIIYTALAWRNKAYGSGSSFAWKEDSNTYAVLEGRTKVKLYKNFKEKGTIGGLVPMEALHGGNLLGGRGTGFVIFWNWETNDVVRRIDADARDISWSPNGTLVAIIAEDSFYVLRFNQDAYLARVDSGVPIGDEGVEEAFEVVAEIEEGVKTSKWIGECFVYTNKANRVNYLVGSEIETISFSEQPLYILAFVPALGKLLLADKDFNGYAYTLNLDVIEYQSTVLRGDMEAAAELLQTIPETEHTRIARFLDARNQKELAITITKDPDHKFDLALALDDLDTAVSITESLPEDEADVKWRHVGERALAVWRFDLAKTGFDKAKDWGMLLMVLMAMGDKEAMEKLAETTEEAEQYNLAFVARLQIADAEGCINILTKTDRIPEATLFARTYAPSRVPGLVSKWRDTLKLENRPKIAATVASPAENPELFTEGWEEALEKEEALLAEKDGVSAPQSKPTEVNGHAGEDDAEAEKDSPPLVQLDDEAEE